MSKILRHVWKFVCYIAFFIRVLSLILEFYGVIEIFIRRDTFKFSVDLICYVEVVCSDELAIKESVTYVAAITWAPLRFQGSQ